MINYRARDQLFPEMVGSDLTADNPAMHYLCSSPVDRSLDEYSEGFGFDLSLLKKAKVLDLGAGQHGRFAYEAGQAGLDVTAVNPAWQSKRYINAEQAPNYWRADGQKRVAAQAEHLPFKSGTFDFVFSLWGVPAYLPGTWDAYHNAFTEIHRVLRIGGIALLMPLPAVTAKQSAFSEVLESAVGSDYNVLTKGLPPKLMITKGRDPNDELVELITEFADRMTQSYLE